MNAARPLVSVVVPTRHRSELLMARALRKALAQTLARLKMLRVPDGPVPATEHALAKHRPASAGAHATRPYVSFRDVSREQPGRAGRADGPAGRQDNAWDSLEALAMGLPVVTTSSVGNPEAVQHGQTGLVVPERDEVQLAHAISRLLLDAGLRRRFGVAALRDMRARFDVRQLVKGLEAPYTRTAERGPLSASGEACLRTHEAEALDPA